MNATRPFGALDYDQADDAEAGRVSGALFLLATSAMYWASIWVASGFPPLVALVSGIAPRTDRR